MELWSNEQVILDTLGVTFDRMLTYRKNCGDKTLKCIRNIGVE